MQSATSNIYISSFVAGMESASSVVSLAQFLCARDRQCAKVFLEFVPQLNYIPFDQKSYQTLVCYRVQDVTRVVAVKRLGVGRYDMVFAFNFSCSNVLKHQVKEFRVTTLLFRSSLTSLLLGSVKPSLLEWRDPQYISSDLASRPCS